MTKSELVRYEMLLRVRDFGAAHRELFPESSDGANALATVAQATAEIGAQTTNKQITASHGREAMAVARARVLERMETIARTARGLQKVPGPGYQPLRITGRMSHTVLSTTARTFLREAEVQREALTRLGLPPACIADLHEAADAFEAAQLERRNGLAGTAVARKAIAEAITSGLTAVRTLDIVVGNALENNPALAEGWKRVRRLGKVRTRTGNDETVEAVTPAAPVAATTPAAEETKLADSPVRA